MFISLFVAAAAAACIQRRRARTLRYRNEYLRETEKAKNRLIRRKFSVGRFVEMRRCRLDRFSQRQLLTL